MVHLSILSENSDNLLILTISKKLHAKSNEIVSKEPAKIACKKCYTGLCIPTERLRLGSSFASKSFIVTSIVFKNH